MREEIINLRNQAINAILSSESSSQLDNVRSDFLGRNGKLTKLIGNIKNLEGSEKKEVGILINQAKETILSEIAEKRSRLKNDARVWFDPTIPGEKIDYGHIHLVTVAIDEISSIFNRLGFVRMRYPEVEWDYFAFESLNFSKNHPARDEWETFLIDTKSSPKYGPMLLTPHTSSGQVREMWREKSPPIRMINIAKTYRRQIDVSHYPMFHQFEGLVIDRNISISNLKATLDYFVQNYFGKDRETRLRPYNFPFTEPSFEVDITCDICKGRGCRLCKEGWLELGGAGMVHPNVLRHGKIDPNIYRGFAFGWGVERVFMMKAGLGIPDIRILYSANLDYLTQY